MTAAMTIRMLVAVGLAVATLAGPAPAQTPAQPPAQPLAQPQPTANSLAIAKEILVLRATTTVLAPVVTGVIEQARGMFEQQNPALGKDLRDVSAKLRKDLDPKREEIINVFVRSYAQHFTEAELKDLLAFYKTPLGKKVLSEEPLAIEDGLKAAQTWADQLSASVIEMYRVEMKKKGHDL
jgi:uncharacterized protein